MVKFCLSKFGGRDSREESVTVLGFLSGLQLGQVRGRALLVVREQDIIHTYSIELAMVHHFYFDLTSNHQPKISNKVFFEGAPPVNGYKKGPISVEG